jgi:hypothetical protein
MGAATTPPGSAPPPHDPGRNGTVGVSRSRNVTQHRRCSSRRGADIGRSPLSRSVWSPVGRAPLGCSQSGPSRSREVEASVRPSFATMVRPPPGSREPASKVARFTDASYPLNTSAARVARSGAFGFAFEAWLSHEGPSAMVRAVGLFSSPMTIREPCRCAAISYP